MYALLSGETFRRDMPASDALLRSGIAWGRFDELFTAAYWCGQTWQAELHGFYRDVTLGRTLVEETAACLLGGYGMPAEIGLAAYRRLRDRGVLTTEASAAEIEKHLEEPFVVAGKTVRYRFPRQKARYLSGCLSLIKTLNEERMDDVGLREALVRMPGIGRKTASWIVRNRRNSSAVAVLDVHVLRAGRLLGLFRQNETPERHYLSLEERFVDLASELEVPAWRLDAVMWQHMRLLRHA
jgi:thermostable 8-oxoguanine DNA glycosylase